MHLFPILRNPVFIIHHLAIHEFAMRFCLANGLHNFLQNKKQKEMTIILYAQKVSPLPNTPNPFRICQGSPFHSPIQ
ncbi:hypothetical protein BofuT4_P156680.1 [Botrytis cinerea T4]|uniref:Uncharacterized protein n=1 Tax=Botryotinia fuckeliana (strain T4) TaxID=999810 RepID=G2YUH4_BOTF4|nr:hypothetical protein BofuT4_P156680.1 [Botrytis cinerea T4]